MQNENRAVVSKIVIIGNERIEPGTIISYMGVKEGDTVGKYEIDRALRDLFATGFFANVDIKMTPSQALEVHVSENPMVNRVGFEGNDYLDDDALNKELQLKPRVIYTRPKIQADVTRLLDLYRRAGRFSATVKPQLVMREQNRVDIVYKIDEGPVAKVARINFIGNKSFSTSDLMEVVRTSEECWYCFLTDADKYDPDKLSYDQELLRKFYTNQGYADFQVKTAIAELTPDKREFYITFTIVEGEKYHFGNITFNSALPGTNAEELKTKVKTKENKIYSSEAVESSVDALTTDLGNQGYAFVAIDPKLDRHPDTHKIDLSYNLKEGPRVYVERIDIKGNQRTLDEVIRREFRLVEGDPFSTEKLKRSEQRLNNLGFFEKVNVTNVPGTAPDKTVVNVDVTEASTGEVTIGAGYSTTDGPLTQFGVKEKNLLGGGQELRLNGLISAKRQEYDLGYTEPYFLDRDLSASIDIFRTQQDFQTESDFDRTSTGIKPSIGYSLSENLRQSFYYSIANTKIGNVDASASTFIKEQQGTSLESLVGQSLSYDRRNNKFDPTEGYNLVFDTDVAGLGGDSKFLRPELRGSFYYSFVPQWTMLLAGSAGIVAPFDHDVLIQDRFFVGQRTLRGFEDAGIGPRDLSTNDALGGDKYYTGTLQLDFPLGLPEDLGFRGSIFTDIGSLFDTTDSGPTVADSSSLRASAGVGVSWKSPFGPVRLDLAVPYKSQSYDRNELVNFSFGTRF